MQFLGLQSMYYEFHDFQHLHDHKTRNTACRQLQPLIGPSYAERFAVAERDGRTGAGTDDDIDEFVGLSTNAAEEALLAHSSIDDHPSKSLENKLQHYHSTAPVAGSVKRQSSRRETKEQQEYWDWRRCSSVHLSQKVACW